MEQNKIKFGAFALLAIGMTSCALDEDFRHLENETANESNNNPTEIGFKVLNPQTRGTESVTKFLPTQFEITAFDGDMNYYNGGTDFVTSSDKGDTWESNRRRLWPKDKPEDWEGLTFYAYIDGNDNALSRGPRSATGKFDVTSTVPTIRNFEVDGDVSKQRDLMYAVAKDVNKKTNNGNVSLHFRHALSKISFTTQNCNPALDDIKIISIELGGVKGKATYYYPEASTEGGMKVDFRNSNEGRWIFASDATENSYIITDPDMCMYLIPQSVDARMRESDSEGGFIKLTVMKTPKGSTTANTPETVYLPLSIEWQEGYSYVYTISWKPSALNFSVTASDFN